jgi:hypothetical protein
MFEGFEGFKIFLGLPFGFTQGRVAILIVFQTFPFGFAQGPVTFQKFKINNISYYCHGICLERDIQDKFVSG